MYVIKSLLFVMLFTVSILSAQHGFCMTAEEEAKEAAAQNKHLEELFQNPKTPAKEFAGHTFVIFIQGAADHYVPPSLEEIQGKWGRADAKDSAEIRQKARECKSCNVVM